MHIRILGTAAAEGWPAIFCGCPTCRKVREVGGKNIRSRASIQFGNRHKIDLPPDTFSHGASGAVDLSLLEHLFVSHSHGDHWSIGYLGYLFPPFAHERPGPLNIYGNEAVVRTGREKVGSREGETVVFHELEPFVPVQADEFTFTPIVAQHKPDERCLNYIVSDGQKRVLYTCDTGYYDDPATWAFLEGVQLDGVISECTCGPVKCERNHLDFEHLFAVKERLENSGCFRGDLFVATHFSHNVGMLHDELESIFSEHGIITAYDGMEITL